MGAVETKVFQKVPKIKFVYFFKYYSTHNEQGAETYSLSF